MSNYSCYINDGVIKIGENRYSELSDNRVIGNEFWKRSYLEQNPIVDSPLYNDLLSEKRALINAVGKRVFISHRQADEQIARRVATMLRIAGIYYWLDVLDPQLQNTNITSIQTANIIEIALLNCTHVVAIMTDNSFGSTWIPYEYGRVKDKRLIIKNAIAYKYNLTRPLPEYMELGIKFDSVSMMINFLRI
ncbi:toll/interleukin-1 receptor domain-containing protein [Portibacter marinus]|uniref:toll/interleukin-1 receptor domain-containing protein n=1 Tax=Portibacter marinus TaxID=2898660 RepID=UPI001F1EA32D|nr:toll/interleukin-1 receptor domain-containing protein [Portibacter marinus]